MWMPLKRVLYVVLLASLFSAPVTGVDASYQMTETELTQLEAIFNQLRTAQQEQEKQIELLKSRLKKSETAIRQSENSLTQANKSLQESAAEAKRTRDRLERQRDTWAVVAILALGVAAAR